MEMLSITLELLRKGDIDKRVKAIRREHEHLGFSQKKPGTRRISFVPDAVPMNPEVYQYQREVLAQAA